MKNSENWLSYHIFCHDYSMHDKIICVLYFWATEAGFSENCFFIRYWEGGPHIRFRFKEKSELQSHYKTMIENLLRDKLSGHKRFTKKQYYEGNKLDGQKIPIQDLPWYENNSIVSIEYVREYERYGGEKLICDAELVFNRSSALAATFLNTCANCKQSIRILYYLYVYSKVKRRIIDNGINLDFERFYSACFSYWCELYEMEATGYIINIANQIKKGIKTKNKEIEEIFSFIEKQVLDDFIKAVIENMQKISSIIDNSKMCSVLFSQMHMFANRIGIPIEYECAIYGYLMLSESEKQ